MNANAPNTRVARFWRVMFRGTALGLSYLAIWAGTMLLLMQSSSVVVPELALLIQKLFSVLGGSLVAVTIGAACLASGVVLRKRVMMLRQAENDRSAQSIMAALRADPKATVRPFALYLRAFETTGRMHVPLYLRLRKLSQGIYRLETNDLESYVSHSVRGIAPLIALGRSGEAIGAGRITADDSEWERDVLTLVRRARGILLVPSSRPGTLWEIEMLKRENLLHKVVFVMPPRSKGALDTRERWDQARSALASHGLEAPEYEPNGLLFEVDPEGKVSNVEPLLLNSARQVRRSLQRILSDAPPKGGLDRSVAVADRRLRRARFWGWLETLRLLAPYPLAAATLFVGFPDVGFDPHESWSTVFGRSMTSLAIAEFETTRGVILEESAGFRAARDRIPKAQFGECLGRLARRGVARLEDDDRRAFFSGFAEMLERGGLAACSALEGDSVAMAVALSYIPFDQVEPFLRAKVAAIVAAAEERPVAEVEPEAFALAEREFLAGMSAADRERFDRISAIATPSSDDQCWLIRTACRAVTTLSEPHATAWARSIALDMNRSDDTTSTAAQ
jgi:hypothetical protein